MYKLGLIVHIRFMSIEVMNTDLVKAKIKEHGWTRSFVIAKLGMGQDGYKFLRGEWLPKDDARKALLIGKLAKMLGVRVPQILVRYEAKETA